MTIKQQLATFHAPRPTELITAGIALANGVRLAWAYAYADAGGVVFSPPGAAGLILGASLSLGTAWVAGAVSRQVAESEMPKIKGAKRTPSEKAKERKARRAQLKALGGSAGLAALLILEPFILAPITLTDMPSRLVANLPGAWAWAWSAALAVAPSIILAALAFAGGTDAPAAPRMRSTKPRTAHAKPEPAPADAQSAPAVKQDAPEVQCTEPGCGMPYKNKAAHYRWHHRQPVEVDRALLIDKEL